MASESRERSTSGLQSRAKPGERGGRRRSVRRDYEGRVRLRAKDLRDPGPACLRRALFQPMINPCFQKRQPDYLRPLNQDV